MSKPCSLCGRSDVTRIDAALKSGEAYRAIAERFLVSRSSLGRHREHMARRPRTLEEMDAEFVRGIEELSRQPAFPSRVSSRKTASGDSEVVITRSKTGLILTFSDKG